jgi:hypothetical protein
MDALPALGRRFGDVKVLHRAPHPTSDDRVSGLVVGTQFPGEARTVQPDAAAGHRA